MPLILTRRFTPWCTFMCRSVIILFAGVFEVENVVYFFGNTSSGRQPNFQEDHCIAIAAKSTKALVLENLRNKHYSCKRRRLCSDVFNVLWGAKFFRRSRNSSKCMINLFPQTKFQRDSQNFWKRLKVKEANHETIKTNLCEICPYQVDHILSKKEGNNFR